MISLSKVALFTLSLASQVTTMYAIGYNGRVDILHPVNHKEEIESLLNKRYSGNSAPTATSTGGDIHHLKEILQRDYDSVKGSNDDDVRRMSRKALVMAAKKGKLISFTGIGWR